MLIHYRISVCSFVRKALCLVLSLVLACSLVPVVAYAQDGDEQADETNQEYTDDSDDADDETTGKLTPSLSATSLELVYSAEAFAIPLASTSDGAITYTVSDTSILTIDEYGQVTTKKLGTTTVAVSIAETSAYEAFCAEVTISVIASVETPVLTGIERSGSSATISWNAVSGASEYGIYRKTASGAYERISVVSADNLSYTDEALASAVTYSYKVRAYGVNRKDYSTCSSVLKCRYLLAPTLSATNSKTGVVLTWTKVTGCSGYYVYRGTKRIATLSSSSTLSYTDTTAKNTTTYTYKVVAYHESSASIGDAATKRYVYMSRSSVTSLKKTKTKLRVAWKKNTGASGYQIQYSTSPLFTSKKTVTVTKASTTAKTITGLKANKTYYVRIRAYKTVSGKKYYSAWKTSSNVSSTKVATVSYVKVNGKKIELRAKTKQKLYGYDTVQGSCTDGTYGYYVMYNRTKEKCKIAKVKLSSMKLVKVSAALSITHGNGITYNSDTKKLVVAHASSESKKISTVNASTLTVESTTSIKLTSSLAGISASNVSNQKGYAAISYNASRKQYVLLTRSTGNLVITDENLQPVRYVVPTKKDNQLLQSIDTTNDYILVASSFKGSKKYNVVSVYDWDGNFITRIRLGTGYELESIYHVGSKFYAATYRSYYKTYYTYKTVKKKVNGKTKTVKTKVKHKKLVRDNYVYRFTF